MNFYHKIKYIWIYWIIIFSLFAIILFIHYINLKYFLLFAYYYLSLKLGINSRVILKRNTDVDRGLWNGALGLVTGFRFGTHDSNKIGGVVVKFDRLQQEVVIG
jgi:hypothetical protein